MSFNIDVNRIKNSLAVAWQVGTAKTSEWMGHMVTLLKSGAEIAMPYLQDKRIAIVSLIAVNLLLVETVNLFDCFWQRHCPNDTSSKRLFRDVVDITFGFSVITAGVIAFAKCTKLPLTALAITCISAGTLLVRTALSAVEN